MTAKRTGIAVIVGAAIAGGLWWTTSVNRERRLDDVVERGFAAARKGEGPQAQALFNSALQARPNDPRVLLLGALLARQYEDHALAQERLDAYERQAGRTPAGLLETAMATAQRGELPPHVEGFLRDELKKNSEEAPLIREALAKGYVHSRRLDEALACVEDLLTECPDHAAALVLRGALWEAFREMPEAVRDFRRAVALDPENREAQLRLALALAKTGQAGEAVPLLEALRQRQPEQRAVLVELAKCRRELGEPEKAQALLDDLVARQSQDAAVWIERGKLALAAGRLDAAQHDLRIAYGLTPFDNQLNYALARLFQVQDRGELAQRWQARYAFLSEEQARIKEAAQKSMREAGPTPWRFETGALFLCVGQVEEGLRWLHGLAQPPSSDAASRKLLDLWQEHAAKPLSMTPFRETRLMLAEHYRRHGDAQRALQQTERAAWIVRDWPFPEGP